ncbi:antiviral innate immune response receptor RIG-I-like [Physella acuta]|uniref:antiviral innate immune response receptor RIG-I-like n=1 Tax=Physella acuta TaxID=109671 RepID=UPI0027DE1366|nr:antiviral innate immune response receptor RIG-I-like [Physella acuta]XP_059177105.1 antiviral innate immune response receptor RIG-I-like [Physella acuta]XP_059177106.1 antiviral innate immune response receptor RIG-I-like [Physella acuta]
MMDELINKQRVIIDALRVTFMKYLQPEVIVQINEYIKNHEAEIFSTCERESCVHDLIRWALENDEAMLNFIQALKSICELSVSTAFIEVMVQGPTGNADIPVFKYLNSIVGLIDESLTKKLTTDDMNFVLHKLFEDKIISQENYDKLMAIEDPMQCCSSLYGNIKRGKHDWVFVFISALFEKNPSILSNNIRLVEAGQLNDKDSTTPKECSTTAASLSSHHGGHFDIPESEVSREYTDAKRISENCKVELTTSELNKPITKRMLKNNVIDSKHIEEVKDNYMSYGEGACCSDEDEDEDKTSTDPPSLNLKDYQVELAQKALDGLNTVIVAPTGSGKTRVAIKIILQHLEKNSGRNKKKKIAFFTRTVPLAIQQMVVLNKFLPENYKVKTITGQTEDALSFNLLIEPNDIFVMTPTIFETGLKKGTIKLSRFSLLIFDECHHVRKDEPYNRIMYYYLKIKINGKENRKKNLPQIIGLSASINVDKATTSEEAVSSILITCSNLDAPHLSTVVENIKTLSETVPVPKEEDYQLKERDVNDFLLAIKTTIKKLEESVKMHAEVLQCEKINEHIKKIPGNKKSQDYENWIAVLKKATRCYPIIDFEKETNLAVRSTMIIADYLLGYRSALESYDLLDMMDVIGQLKNKFSTFSVEEHRSKQDDEYYGYFEDLVKGSQAIKQDNNPNLNILRKTLLKFLNDGNSRAIIFVRTRALAESLTNWLSRTNDLKYLNAHIFTSANVTEQSGGMSPEDQKETLSLFLSGNIRVLVATSVAEEGLDIPECSLIIKYNHVGNEIFNIQTKGRARTKGASSFLLAYSDVLSKEQINREKTKIMNKAFILINTMPHKTIESIVTKNQKDIYEKRRYELALKAKKQRELLHEEFTLVCSMCRKVCIKSSDIRVYDTFMLSVDKELLKAKLIECLETRKKFLTDFTVIGAVYCRGKFSEGKTCGHKLGTMITFSGSPYLAISIRKCCVYKNNPDKLEQYEKWSDVPYFIKEMDNDDPYLYNDVPQESSDDDGDDKDDDSDEDNENTSCMKIVDNIKPTEKQNNVQQLTVINDSSDSDDCKPPETRLFLNVMNSSDYDD